MPLQIVAVLQGLAEGGSIATCCANQLTALSDEHHCLLISDSGVAPGATHLPVRALRVPSLRFLHRFAHVPRQILFILLAARSLRKLRRERRVDLLIFHSHPPTALLSRMMQRILKCQVAMVMHGDIHDRPGDTYDARLTWWYRICTSPAYRRANAILALSPYMARLAIRGGADPAHVFLAPNGVDRQEIGLRHPTDPAHGQNLLFIGRLEYNKGIDLLIEAFMQIASQYTSLQLTCIGSADTRFLTPYQRRLKPLAMEDRVVFLPPQPRLSLGTHFQKACLVVIPSRSETQSTVAMEAMAAGRAVVASNTGGNPMLVDEPNTGLLFRNGDADDLADKIHRLISSPNILVTMGQAAQHRHQHHFSRHRSAESLRERINCIASGKASPDQDQFV